MSITTWLNLTGQGQEGWHFLHWYFFPSELFSSLWRSSFSLLWINYKLASSLSCELGGQSNGLSSCCRSKIAKAGAGHLPFHQSRASPFPQMNENHGGSQEKGQFYDPPSGSKWERVFSFRQQPFWLGVCQPMSLSPPRWQKGLECNGRGRNRDRQRPGS